MSQSPARASTPPAADPDGDGGSTLTVTVSATPKEAAERLWQILKLSGMTLTVRVLPTVLPEAGPSCWESNRPASEIKVNDPLRFSFPGLPLGEYSMQVEIGKYPRQPPHTFQLRESEQEETFRIAFRELRVEAEPTFGLYVADYRSRLLAARGARRSALDFVARSGARDESRFLLSTDARSVRFFFWDLAYISAVLTASETGEARETKPLDVPIASALTTPFKIAEPDDRLRDSPFAAVTFAASKLTGGPP